MLTTYAWHVACSSCAVMQDLDIAQLITVTGGTKNVANKSDDQTELALTKLASDIKDLGRNNNQQNTQLTTLLAVALMSRFR